MDCGFIVTSPRYNPDSLAFFAILTKASVSPDPDVMINRSPAFVCGVEIEDAIQSNQEKGSIGLINSLAKLFVEDKITLAQAKEQIEEKNIETLNRTIMQLKIKRDMH